MRALVGRLLGTVMLCSVPALAGAHLALVRDRIVAELAELRHGRFTESAMMVLVALVCAVCWVALVVDGTAGLLAVRRGAVPLTAVGIPARLMAAVAGASVLGLAAGTRSANANNTAPSKAHLSVAGAGSLALGIGAVGGVVRGRGRVEGTRRESPVPLSVEPDGPRTGQASPPVPTGGENGPRVVVRVFGAPLAEAPDGGVAEFRKARSLELLVWLALNRDRPLRSAARTAIWELDVSDSSFATVVSEMRRGLAQLVPEVPAHLWCPPTYGDEIVLSSSVCTDAEVIAACLAGFRRDPPAGAEPLAAELVRIRDLPFSGVEYLWPDLDGTTTRLVMLAVEAIEELAEWSLVNERGRHFSDVVAAGLRMLPGNERLTELQREMCGGALKSARRRVASVAM